MFKHSISPRFSQAILSTLIQGLAIASTSIPLVVPIAQAQVINQQQQWIASAENVTALRRAIIGQESSANFRAVNRHSGALGYGQIMPDNLPQWSLEALGYSVSRNDFLNNPQIQLQIIDYRLAQYWKDAMMVANGDEALAVLQVASRWYSGNPNRYHSTTPQYYGGHRYPSISEYSFSVLQRYQQERLYLGMNPTANPL